MTYDRAKYWSEVAGRVSSRTIAAERDVAGPAGPVANAQRALAVEKLTALPVRGRTVLEIGPGPGGNLKLLAGLGPSRLIGCEVAPSMVDLSRRSLGESAEIYQIDGASLPLADGEVDLTFTCTVLQHNSSNSALALLSEVARVTTGPVVLLEDLTAGQELTYDTYFVRNPQWYSSAMAEHGFALRQIESLSLLYATRGSKVVQSLGRCLTRRADDEGSMITRTEAFAEEMLLRAAGPFDRRGGFRRGLAYLWFERL